jgi:cyclic pyranopterin phosphate synthase
VTPLRLVDRRERAVRYLRVSLTDRCNYRCTYCMPPEPPPYGPRHDVLSLEEIVRLVAAFARWGVQRVRLTGGEPTIRRGLVELVQQLTAIRSANGELLEVVMTTNGETLAELARPLRDAGLAGLTVSLDSLDPQRFAAITRRGDLSAVLAGLEAARDAGFARIGLNTVAIAGFNHDELHAIAGFAWDRGIVPRFIEIMPMAGGELFVPGELMSAAAVRAAIADACGGTAIADDGAGVRGSGPATYWRIESGPRHGARFGTIAAMTENFCSSCNRLRVSATGQLHGCLARDETGDLRAALRANAPGRLEAVVRHVLGTKRDGHGFDLDGTGGPTKAMISIGG